MDLELEGDVWFWRGPAPFHVVSVPDELCNGVVTVRLTIDD